MWQICWKSLQIPSSSLWTSAPTQTLRHLHKPAPAIAYTPTELSVTKFIWRKLTIAHSFILSLHYIQVTVLDLSMLTMSLRSLSVEQTPSFKFGSLLFFLQYIWHHLWTVNKRHTVKRIDLDKMLLFVPQEHGGIFKQRKTFHDSPGTSFL